MKKLIFSAAMIAFVTLQCLVVGESAEAPAQPADLRPGTYSAHIKGMVSHSSLERVRSTLMNMEGITNVSIDPRTNQVRFGVKQDAMLKVSEIQWTLRAAALQAGQGKCYKLQDIVLLPKDSL